MSELEHCRLAHEGRLDLLKQKIESNKFEDLTKKKDQSGRTVLHWACVGSKKEVFDYLVNVLNLKLDEPDEAGWTPLIISASVGCYDIAKVLLEKGCDPNNETETKIRALHYAASKNWPNIVTLLLDNGAHVNAVDTYGSSALHRAASKGNIKIAELLLAKKANPNLPDSEGNTPLHLACEEVRIEMAKLLLKHGANPNLKNKEEKTPIDVSHGGLQNVL